MNDKEYLKELDCIPYDILTVVKRANREIAELNDKINADFYNGVSWDDLCIKYAGMNEDGNLFDMNYGSLNVTILNNNPYIINLVDVGIYPDEISKNNGQEMFSLDYTRDVIPSEIKKEFEKEHFNDVICTHWEISPDYLELCQPLLEYEHTPVAWFAFKRGNDTINIGLVVEGEVRIEYKGEIYKNVGQFPNELVNIIVDGKEWEHPDVAVHSNNWLETEIIVNGREVEGDTFELNSNDTKQDILSRLTGVVEWCINNYCKAPENNLDNEIEKE